MWRKSEAEMLGPMETRASFWRSLQTFNITRVVVAGVLVGYINFTNAQLPFFSNHNVIALTSILYFIAALLLALTGMFYRHRFILQLLAQILLDLCVISLLYIAGGGARSGLAILYLLPLAGLAVLAPLTVALFFVSLVSIFLLLEGTYQILMQEEQISMLQTGLYGTAFFTTVFVVSRLAGKLIRQEELAIQRGRDLAMQEAINRLVIADVGDGVMVLGPDTTIYTRNPAAQSMLGLTETLYPEHKRVRLNNIEGLQAITEAYQSWLANQPSPASFGNSILDLEGAYYVMVRPGDAAAPVAGVWSGRRDLSAHLKLRFVKVKTEALSEARTVVFMRDVSEIENQAQQLKLASMGRLTASIAHEVRNPLAAISHAAALLSEELNSKTQVRLLNIIGDNVTRMNRMIEDILQLSRKTQSHAEPIALSVLLAEIRAEFIETHGLPESLLELGEASHAMVRFDPLHLREVVVNLLSNAVRYASGKAGSIKMLEVFDGANRLELHVQDDGPGISAEVRAHLFEPFYTTSSKGTGLGLYLARELCMNNGAMLDYEYRIDNLEDDIDQASGRFVVSFAPLENKVNEDQE